MSYLRNIAAQSFKEYQENYKIMNPMIKKVKSYFFDRAYYPQIGLKADDLHRDTPVLMEALRRLPKDELEKRLFRINTAFHLSTNKVLLPEKEWTKIVDDDPYLKPYMELVEREMQEFQDWDFK